MIEPDKRKAIYQLHLEGMSIRKISRQLKVSRNSVRDIIAHRGEVPEVTRIDKIEIDTELLQRIYNECDGWRERMHEKLEEEEGIKIGYSTLTRILRESGMEGKGKGKGKSKPRSIRIADQRDA